MVERDLLCRDADINGELLMWSARIGGTLVLEGARIVNPEGATFNGDGIVVDGGLFGSARLPGHRLVSQGVLRLQDARISRCCVLSGAQLNNPADTEVRAERLHVDGPLALDSAAVDGTVQISGSAIQGPLQLQSARFDGAGQCTFDASLARISGDLVGTSGLSARGQVTLDGAHIEGSLDLTAARLHNPGRLTLAARRMHVAGRINCRGLSSDGHIVLNDAVVGTSIEFHGARLSNPAGITLTAKGLRAGGAFECCGGFVSDGGMSFTGSSVAGVLCLKRATIVGRLSLRKIRAGSVRTKADTALSGPVDFRHSQIDVLADDPARWPGDLLLDGLTYRHLEASLPVRDRLAWLAKDSNGYLPQPYGQLATTYTAQGHDAAARQVLLAKCRRQRAGQPATLRIWGHIQDWTVGYGYRPMRAAAWLVLLLLTATLAFASHHPPKVKRAEAPTFNAFLYTLDLLVPVVSFGQEQAFNPHGWQQWLAAALIAAGWILATTIAAGLTRSLSRQ
ncbi:oxidoreductase [Streptomyces mirabilis]|uniref:oxidoreductase n=1 Tax=Streptomyces mirabilis TaxID=68239 RepID=UPI0038032CB4